MSFWSEQAISQSPGSAEIIKKGEVDPDKWDLPEGIECLSPEDVSYEELSKWLLEHNTAGTTTSTLFSRELFDYLRKKDQTIWIVLKDSLGIVATCFGLIIKCSFQDKPVLTCHTIYLCVRKDTTGKGLAGSVIRRVMSLGSRIGVYVGYHQVNKPIGKNAIEVNGWWYPIKPKIASSIGFKMPVRGSHSEIRKHFHLQSDPEITFEPVQKHLKFVYSEWQKYPVRLEWYEFIKFLSDCPNMSSFVACSKGQPLSLISWRTWSIYFLSVKEVHSLALLEFFTSPSVAVIASALPLMNAPVLYLHEIGSVNREFLESMHATMSGNRWLNWYNWNGHHTSSDVLLPFL